MSDEYILALFNAENDEVSFYISRDQESGVYKTRDGHEFKTAAPLHGVTKGDAVQIVCKEGCILNYTFNYLHATTG